MLKRFKPFKPFAPVRGKRLDLVASLYGVERKRRYKIFRESDKKFRARLLIHVTNTKQHLKQV